MTYKDPEKQKEYDKKYRLENIEKKKEYEKKYRLENREQKNEYLKKYRLENKEKIKEKNKEYRKTEAGKKTYRITTWKQHGVVCDDWDKLYDKYINTWNCEHCNKKLIEGMYGNNKRCLDHDHQTGLFRAVLCHYCNVIVFKNI